MHTVNILSWCIPEIDLEDEPIDTASKPGQGTDQ